MILANSNAECSTHTFTTGSIGLIGPLIPQLHRVGNMSNMPVNNSTKVLMSAGWQSEVWLEASDSNDDGMMP